MHSPDRSVSVLLGVFLFLSLIPLEGQSHLALIRQGSESANSPESQDRFGAAFAVGDFNGDGFDDLATSAPDDDNGNLGTRQGVVVINYGSEHGLTHVGAKFLFFTDVDTDSRFGFALAAGDFDNDGFDDLVVCRPHADTNGAADSGEIRVYLGEVGGPSPFSIPYDQSDANGFSEAGDLFGWSATTGRFNNDDYDDLVVGAPGENGGEGVVFYFWGGSQFGGWPFGLEGGGFYDQGDLGGVGTPGDSLGYSLTTGDMLSDAHSDIAIGAPYADGSPTTDAGRVYVVAGGATGFNLLNVVNTDANTLGHGATAEGLFGWSLASGDFWDSSGRCDLAVGEPGYNITGIPKVGRVIVAHVATALQGADSSIAITQSLGQEANEALDRFGFALAAGDYMGDGDDELIVGTPYEDVIGGGGLGQFGDAGLVQIFGTSANDFPNGTEKYDGSRANDVAQIDYQFGYALALGRFDSNADNRAGLAIGAPGAVFRVWEGMSDLGVQTRIAAGQVHIVSEWRQPEYMSTRCAIATNCQGEIVFSLRPFDFTEIASTTKTMTVWLAAEAITNGEIDSTASYTVGCWLANCFKGSDAEPGLGQGEQIKLIDLMKLAVTESAGDACLAIADLMTGQVDGFPGCNNPCPNIVNEVMPTFVALMNQRAVDIDMLDTKFTNPHGSGSGTFLGSNAPHHSTAFDMEILTRNAMQNPLFAIMVRPEGWNIIRTNIYGEGGIYVQQLNNQHVAGLNSDLKTQTGDPSARAPGVKRGFNTYANSTGLAMGTLPSLGQPPVVAVNLGTVILDKPGNGTLRTSNNVALMTLALARCDSSTVTFSQLPPGTATFEPLVRLEAVPADQDSVRLAGAQLNEDGDDTEGEDVLIEAFRIDIVDSVTSLDLSVQHQTAFELLPRESTLFGIAPYDGHRGIRVHNLRGTIPYDITLSHPTGTTPVTLPELGWYDVAPDSTVGGGSFRMTLTNTSTTDTALVEVEEIGYVLQVELAGGYGSFYSATLERDASDIVYEQISVAVLGRDTAAGNTVEVTVRTPDVPVSTGDEDENALVPRNALIEWTRVYPNPFNPTVTIEYRLERAVHTSIDIFDVSGRHIRQLQSLQPRSGGRNTVIWNGSDESGVSVASGIYYYLVRAENTERSGTLVLVR